MILKVNEPVEALGSAVTVRGEVAKLPEGGVTGDVTAILTPEGAVPTQDPTRVTAELKALSEVIVIVAELPPPRVREIDAVDEVIEKSGAGPGEIGRASCRERV